MLLHAVPLVAADPAVFLQTAQVLAAAQIVEHDHLGRPVQGGQTYGDHVVQPLGDRVIRRDE